MADQAEKTFSPGFALAAWAFCGVALTALARLPLGGLAFLLVGVLAGALGGMNPPRRKNAALLVPLVIWLLALVGVVALKLPQEKALPLFGVITFAYVSHNLAWGRDWSRGLMLLVLGCAGGLVALLRLKEGWALMAHVFYWPTALGLIWWAVLDCLGDAAKKRPLGPQHLLMGTLVGCTVMAGFAGLMAPAKAPKPPDLPQVSMNQPNLPPIQNQPAPPEENPAPPQLDEATRDRLNALPEALRRQLPKSWRDALSQRQQDNPDSPNPSNPDQQPPPPSPQQDKDDPLTSLQDRDDNASRNHQPGDARTTGENNTPMNNGWEGAGGGGGGNGQGVNNDAFQFDRGMDSGEGRDMKPENRPGAGSGLDREPGMESDAFTENGREVSDGNGGGNIPGQSQGQGGGEPGETLTRDDQRVGEKPGQENDEEISRGLGDKNGDKPASEDCPEGNCLKQRGGGFTNQNIRQQAQEGQTNLDWPGLGDAADGDLLLTYQSPKAMRLRTGTLGYFDGKRWYPLAQQGGTRQHPRKVGTRLDTDLLTVAAMPDTNQSGENRDARITLAKTMHGDLPHPAGTLTLKGQPLPVAVSSEDTFTMNQPAPRGTQWQVRYVPRVFFAGNGTAIPRAYFRPYLDNRHVGDHAAWVAHSVAGQGPPIAKAMALEGFLHNRFGYSANVPPVVSASTLDTLLFDRHVGYCAQFAEAMALMAREVGLPARVVVGLATGEFVGNNTYRVYGSDAHAWTEVYRPGAGWLEFDPTPPPRILKEDPLAGLPPYPGPGWKPKPALGEELTGKVNENPLLTAVVSVFLMAVMGLALWWWLRRRTRAEGEAWGGDSGPSAKLQEQLCADLRRFREEMEAAQALKGHEQTPRELLRRATADASTASQLLPRIEHHLFGGERLDGKTYLLLKGKLALLAKHQKACGPPPANIRWED